MPEIRKVQQFAVNAAVSIVVASGEQSPFGAFEVQDRRGSDEYWEAICPRGQLVPLKEVQPLTGYIRGGVTAPAAKKDYPVFVDEMIELWGQHFGLGRHARHADPAFARRLPARHRRVDIGDTKVAAGIVNSTGRPPDSTGANDHQTLASVE